MCNSCAWLVEGKCARHVYRICKAGDSAEPVQTHVIAFHRICTNMCNTNATHVNKVLPCTCVHRSWVRCVLAVFVGLGVAPFCWQVSDVFRTFQWFSETWLNLAMRLQGNPMHCRKIRENTRCFRKIQEHHINSYSCKVLRKRGSTCSCTGFCNICPEIIQATPRCTKKNTTKW